MKLARSLGLVAACLAAAPLTGAQEAEPPARTRNGGYLGIFIRETVDQTEDPPVRTLTIERVHPGGPAAKAGFQAGDIVAAVNGSPLKNGDQLIKRFWSGPQITVTVKRGDETVDIDTTTRELDSQPKVGDRAPDFTLKSRGGKGSYALKDLLAKGKPVVLVFGSFT